MLLYSCQYIELLLKLLVDCYLIVWPNPYLYQHTSLRKTPQLKGQIKPICKTKDDKLNVFHHHEM